MTKQTVPEEKKTEKKTYELPVWCTNCEYGRDFSAYEEIPYGRPFTTGVCPNCGCYALAKKYSDL